MWMISDEDLNKISGGRTELTLAERQALMGMGVQKTKDLNLQEKELYARILAKEEAFSAQIINNMR